MSIRAGEMRHRVRIEQRSTAVDPATGNMPRAWSLVADRWASLERTPGTEVFAAAQRQGRVPTVFRLRYLAGVVPAMRVVHDGQVYDVKSVVDPTGRKSEMLLVTELLVEATP